MNPDAVCLFVLVAGFFLLGVEADLATAGLTAAVKILHWVLQNVCCLV